MDQRPFAPTIRWLNPSLPVGMTVIRPATISETIRKLRGFRTGAIGTTASARLMHAYFPRVLQSRSSRNDGSAAGCPGRRT
jgi:hypothetical protein